MRTLVICAIIIACLVAAVFIDSKLYYYGKNYWCIHDELPLKINPQYWGYDRGHLEFVLLDKYDMTVVAKGSRYWSSDIKIHKIVKYGYSRDRLVVLTTDTLGKEYYVLVIQNPSISSKQEFKITVISKNDFINVKALKWIDIKKPIRKLELVRNYLVLFSIIMLVIITYRILFKWKNNYKN